MRCAIQMPKAHLISIVSEILIVSLLGLGFQVAGLGDKRVPKVSSSRLWRELRAFCNHLKTEQDWITQDYNWKTLEIYRTV